MILNSPELIHEDEIPSRYTSDGENINPPFKFVMVPPVAKSLAFIVEDPDAPAGLWVHWMIWNIPVNTTEILAGQAPKGIVGLNSSHKNDWDQISPPDEGEHRYFFKLYALDIELELDPLTATRDEFHLAIEGHALKTAELMCKYKKPEVA